MTLLIGAIAVTLSSKVVKVNANTSEQWQVIKVLDGDTVKASKNGQKVNIRFCGIDAPEKAQPLGQQSKANLQRLVDEVGGKVAITEIERDRYGRIVGEIFSSKNGQEKFLNEEQLSSGNAYLYSQYVKNCPNKIALRNAENLAKSKRLGVWSGNYQRPWDYRRQKRSR
ncbi:hypothetical protein BCD64_00035 [Nostoc sp. MBR 210]|nr:hypothetical protein BCD64_00035 [Nostoc sp. MBR 210]